MTLHHQTRIPLTKRSSSFVSTIWISSIASPIREPSDIGQLKSLTAVVMLIVYAGDKV